mgnify:CR=1 FL=1
MAAIQAQKKAVELGKKFRNLTSSPHDNRSLKQKPTHSQYEIEQVLALYSKGKKRAEIAKITGLKAHAVYNITYRYRLVDGETKRTTR